MRYFWIFTLGIAALSFPAQAEVMRFDGISVDLAQPEGYCPLSRANPKDKYRFDQVDRGTSNLVLMFAVPCKELAATRAGRQLSHWATWMELRDDKLKYIDFAGLNHQKALDDFAAAMPSVNLKKVSKEVSYNLKTVKTNTTKVAVVEKNEDAVYFASTTYVSNDKRRVIAAVCGVTILSDREFMICTSSGFENPKTFDALLAVSKDTVNRTNAANSANASR